MNRLITKTLALFFFKIINLLEFKFSLLKLTLLKNEIFTFLKRRIPGKIASKHFILLKKEKKKTIVICLKKLF